MSKNEKHKHNEAEREAGGFWNFQLSREYMAGEMNLKLVFIKKNEKNWRREIWSWQAKNVPP